MVSQVVPAPAAITHKDFPIDTTTVFRNPGMGWLMYVEEYGENFPNPAEYWKTVDPYASKATGLYIRVPWSRMEPTEGHYAWNDDPAFKALIAGAKKRGLKLSFRIFVNSRDVHQQATPEFVFDAGAKADVLTKHHNFKNPYPMDPIFREKFDQFLTAFGKEFDDPNVVDFVDLNTVGQWGEMHTITGLKKGDTAKWNDILDWLAKSYRAAFKKVLLVINYAQPPFGFEKQDELVNSGILMRRDGVGSIKWFKPKNKEKIKEHFPASAFVAENCYQAFTVRKTSCDDGFKPIPKMLERVVNEALDLHANYLDLRKAIDVITWVRDYPQLVEKFGTQGGYRLAPVDADYTATMPLTVGSPLSVTWQNSGVGRLPNGSSQWGNRFSIAYALLDSHGKVVQEVRSAVDPGTIIKGAPVTDRVWFHASVPEGHYTLATAIVDKDNGGAPGVHLAVAGTDFNRPATWTPIGAVTVAKEPDLATRLWYQTAETVNSGLFNAETNSRRVVFGGAATSLAALLSVLGNYVHNPAMVEPLQKLLGQLTLAARQ